MKSEHGVSESWESQGRLLGGDDINWVLKRCTESIADKVGKVIPERVQIGVWK